MSNTHGGARPGSGPKPTPIDERRVLVLREQGMSLTAIGLRFGVTRKVVTAALKRARR